MILKPAILLGMAGFKLSVIKLSEPKIEGAQFSVLSGITT